MHKLILVGSFAVVLTALFSAPASAACSEAFYRNLLRGLPAAERSSSACVRASRGNDLSKMCNACRPAIAYYLRLDRAIRKSPSCFNNDRAGRRLVAQSRADRANVRFFARGCGY